jgi:hypothetical protein
VPSELVAEAVNSTLAAVGGIAAVYCLPGSDLFQVFTIIEDDDEAIYDRIYEQERTLIRKFQGVHFDFNVIARRGRSLVAKNGLQAVA